MKTKFLFVFTALILGTLPSMAKIDGKVSQDFFYDTETTIMNEIPQNNSIKGEKYWGKNVLSLGKYKPFFMLSNKDLYNLMPREKVSIVQRISTPSVYNISLKTATVTQVSLKPTVEKKVTTGLQSNKNNNIWASLYEQSKGSEVPTEQKIETALLLKDSKNLSNYNMAINLLNQVTNEEPYNAYAFYLKGELYSSMNNTENAMKNYIESLKINPVSKQSCLGIAKILQPTNKLLAQKYFDMAK